MLISIAALILMAVAALIPHQTDDVPLAIQFPPPLVGLDRDTERKPLDVNDIVSLQQLWWNAGDLAMFMSYYWQSDELVVMSGDQETRGWQATFDYYKKRYQADGKGMGRLACSELVIVPNGPESSFVSGRWQLTMNDGTTPSGGFKLEFRKFPEGWKIVRNTTTSETP